MEARRNGASTLNALRFSAPSCRSVTPFPPLPLSDRNPDLQPAQPRSAIAFRAVSLERRSVSGLVTGLGERLIPDRLPRARHRRHVILVIEDRVGLRRDPQPCELGRLSGELSNLHTADVLDAAGVVAVADHAV